MKKILSATLISIMLNPASILAETIKQKDTLLLPEPLVVEPLERLPKDNPNFRCLAAYEDEIKRLKDKRLIFKPEDGSRLIGSIAQALGATAVGVTAGGVVGLILPYAASGLVYAGMGIGYIGYGLPISTFLAGVTVVSGVNAQEQQYRGEFSDLPPAALWTGLGTPIAVIAEINNWNGRANALISAANVASKAMIGATPYFVAIGAIVGGAAGLTIGLSDGIKNFKIHKLNEAKDMIGTSIEYVQNLDGDLATKMKFNEFYNKLPKKVRKKMSKDTVASVLSELALDSDLLCEDGPLSFRKIKKLLKTYSKGEVDLAALKDDRQVPDDLAIINIALDKQNKLAVNDRLDVVDGDIDKDIQLFNIDDIDQVGITLEI